MTKNFFLLLVLFSANLAMAQGTKFEAENAVLTGVNKASSRTGFSGTGYVTGFDKSGDKITFNIDWDTAGKFELFIGFASPNGDKKNIVTVNGETLGELLFPSGSSFKEVSAGNIFLEKGANKIEILHSWGWFEVDYIRIAGAKSSVQWNISPKPVNPKATAEAVSMYQFLLNNFGKTTFAGQFQNEDRFYTDAASEISYLKNLTGKYPALYGNDLIDYSPSRIAFGSTSKATEDILKWYKEQGGMVTLTWHWNAPTDLPNTSDQPWWSGFYTRATTFDIAWVLNNPDSEKYELLLRDIDVIAEQLKIYQENNIPILWRPLHEAEGAWFWWGAKGPEACVELWRLLYDRLTNYHSINNLIWVWTTTDGPNALKWYPGDDYVDILGVDVYLADGDYSVSATMFENLKTIFQGKKMLTMSENGTIPDPEKMEKQAVRWLYNCTWVGDFIFGGKKNSSEHINYYFNHDKVTTLDELPEFWSDFVGIDEIVKAEDVRIFPNPVSNALNLVFMTPAVKRNICIFDQLGKLIFSEAFADQCSIDTALFLPGVYIVRIQDATSVKNYKIIKK